MDEFWVQIRDIRANRAVPACLCMQRKVGMRHSSTAAETCENKRTRLMVRLWPRVLAKQPTAKNCAPRSSMEAIR